MNQTLLARSTRLQRELQDLERCDLRDPIVKTAWTKRVNELITLFHQLRRHP